MQVASISSSSYQRPGAIESFGKMKQSFEKLGSALESGNLSDAREALGQLQEDAPAQAGKADNPISANIETLSKAVDSGDLKGAQQGYADIKKTISQRPSTRGGQVGGTGGGPRGGSPPAGQASPSGAKKSSKCQWCFEFKQGLRPEGHQQGRHCFLAGGTRIQLAASRGSETDIRDGWNQQRQWFYRCYRVGLYITPASTLPMLSLTIASVSCSQYASNSRLIRVACGRGTALPHK